MHTAWVRRLSACWHVYNRFVEKGGGKMGPALHGVLADVWLCILQKADSFFWTKHVKSRVTIILLSIIFLSGFLGNHFMWCFRVLQRSWSLTCQAVKLQMLRDTTREVTGSSITSRRSGWSRVSLCPILRKWVLWTFRLLLSPDSLNWLYLVLWVSLKASGAFFRLQVDFLCHVHKLVQNKQDWQTGAAYNASLSRFCQSHIPYSTIGSTPKKVKWQKRVLTSQGTVAVGAG